MVLTGSLAVSTDFQQVLLAVFNRFSTGRSDWLAVVFHAVMAILPEALTGIEGLGEDGGDLLVDGDDLGAHRGDLCLSTRGGDGGVEEEGHVEHLALQQQPSSLLHLRGNWKMKRIYLQGQSNELTSGSLTNSSSTRFGC